MENTKTSQPLPTQNDAWGFWGTYMTNYGENEAKTLEAWNRVSREIAEFNGATPDLVREYLDSKSGRHIADALYPGDGDIPAWTGKDFRTFLKAVSK